MSERLPEVSELIVPQSWNLLELQRGSEKHVDLLGQTVSFINTESVFTEQDVCIKQRWNVLLLKGRAGINVRSLDQGPEVSCGLGVNIKSFEGASVCPVFSCGSSLLQTRLTSFSSARKLSLSHRCRRSRSL